MAITFNNLLKQITHNEMVCVAGEKGLGKRIENVTVIDSPEILDWLRGGEFVVSTGYVSYSNASLLNTLVSGLKEKGAVGLGLKVNRFYRNVPEILIEEGNRLDFPVFAISYEMRISDIMKMVYTNFFTDSMSKIEKDNILYKKITEALLKGENINVATFNLSIAFHNPALIVDEDFNMISFENHEDNKRDLRKFFHLDGNEQVFSIADAHNLLDYYKTNQFRFYNMTISNGDENLDIAVTPLQINQQLRGFLCIIEAIEKISMEEFSIVENSTSIIEIYLLQQDLQRENRKHEQNSFLSAVLMNHNADNSLIQHNCDIFHFDYLKKRICMYFRFKDYTMMPFYRKKEINDLFENIKKQMAIANRCINFSVFFQEGFVLYQMYGNEISDNLIKENTNEALITALEIFEEKNLKVKVSTSAIGKNIGHISEAFRQVVEGQRLGNIIFPDEDIYNYEEMMVYDLLGNAIPVEHLLSLYNNTVAPVDMIDRENNTEYIKTLEVYLENNCNVSKAAQILHLHRNTMMYRMEHIEDILQMDIKNSETVFNLRLGIRAKKLLKLYQRE